MAENFEDSRKDVSSDSLDLGTRLSNEANVLGAGIAGSFSKIGDGLEAAEKDPGTFALKVAGSAVTGFTLGLLTREAGFWGAVGRGSLGTMTLGAAADVIKPLGTAMSTAWNATSQNQLDAASDRLSSHLGQFEFDTLATMPFAIGGSALGTGLRRSLAGTVSLQSETVAAETAARVKPAEPRMAQPRQTSFGDASFRSSFRPQSKPEVLVGEIVDDPRPRKPQYRKPEPDIIDAEFTVVEEHTLVPGWLNTMKVRGDFRPELLPDHGASVTIAQRQGGSQFALVARDASLESGLSKAYGLLSRQEPGWTLERGVLQSPLHTRFNPSELTPILYRATPTYPSAARLERAIKAYTQNLDGPEPGSLINIKA